MWSCEKHKLFIILHKEVKLRRGKSTFYTSSLLPQVSSPQILFCLSFFNDQYFTRLYNHEPFSFYYVSKFLLLIFIKKKSPGALLFFVCYCHCTLGLNLSSHFLFEISKAGRLFILSWRKQVKLYLHFERARS